MSTATALVLLADPRAATAVTLVLQEMGYAVDASGEPALAIRWLRRARYDLVVTGPVETGLVEYLGRLRFAAGDARVVLLAEADDALDAIAMLDVDLIPPPLDVNALVMFLR